MSLWVIENARLNQGTRVLFQNITFSVNAGDRVGLVGNNGCGKTSLVRALLGEIELDQGSITRQRHARIGYVPQEVPDDIYDETCHGFLLRALPSHAQDTDFWQVDVALSELGLEAHLWHQPLRALSGGWRRLLLIARAHLQDPDLLVMDEPTNHLDLGKIFRLENWLQQAARAALLVISHDREFLDKCTTKTVFMRSDHVYEFAAPYSVARANLLQYDALAARTRHREEQEIQRLERSSKRLMEWANRKGVNPDLARKARAVQNRAEQLKERQTSTYKEERRDIKLHQAHVASDALLLLQNTIIRAPDGRDLFKVDRLGIKQGDRIALLGLNGAGKSVFIRRIIDAFENYEPGPSLSKEIYFSPQMRMGYLDQHLEKLPPRMDLHSFIAQEFKLGHTQTIRVLVAVGFAADQQSKRIGDLSLGEKARLALLVLRLSKPNFYILDEPSNHLDIQGQEDLEEELDDKGHSCLFVSHDRRLVRGAATRFWEIRKKRLIEVESVEPFFETLRAQASEEGDKMLSRGS
ncbi:MAG: ABC-F family ATP-binding cassette domain-containing protein [Alphaproteobacteria bacterium]|nr:MAG: ABC-F family ATP-binding cassette domain-containing protein [Alphaproteobacteria bacterium]